jgi:hypothetical protein
MDLSELARRVDSKETFLEFVEALRADWEASRVEERACPSSPYGSEARGWENPDLGRYLDALGSWLEDADGYYHNTGQVVDTSQPSWRLFADMLMAAKSYE